jgi:hypothetical protein
VEAPFSTIGPDYLTVAFFISESRYSASLRCWICSATCCLTCSSGGICHWTHVFQLDHVVAVLGLDRRIGDAAFLQRGHGLRELRHEAGRVGPAEVAALRCRTRVLALLGQLVELGAALELGDDRFRVVLFLDQDVASVVFLVRCAGLGLVVLGLDLGILDRVLLDEVGQHGVDDDALAGVVDRGLDVGTGAHALLVGFLDQHFTADQVFLDHFAQLRRIGRAALGHDLLDHLVDARCRDRLAVDGRDVLGEGRQRHHRGHGDQQAGWLQNHCSDPIKTRNIARWRRNPASMHDAGITTSYCTFAFLTISSW